MRDVLVVEQQAPPTTVELEAAELAELAEQQADKSLRVVLPESAFQVVIEDSEDETNNPNALPEHLAREAYQRSLEAYRTLGALVLKNEADSEVGLIAKEGLRRMWITSLAEILENDEEFRGFFEINDQYEYDIQDDKVMAAPGKPMVELVKDGALKSRAEAAADPRMITQANRDSADEYNAERVDDIVAANANANTRLVVSKSPRKAIAADPKFWQGKGYRDGLAFAQLYYFDGNKLVAGTFSVDNVDDHIFDRVLAEYDVVVPEDRTSDYSVMDGVERTLGSREEALDFARTFRARCYELQGDSRHRQSINEFMGTHKERIDAIFDTLCLPLSESIESGRKHDTVHTFAEGLLEAEDNLKPEIAAQLRALCAGDTFTDEDGRLLAGLTLYAVAEELYSDARNLVKGETPAAPGARTYNYSSQDQLAQHLAGRVRTGVEAGRSHGGACAGMTDISSKRDKEKEDDDPDNPQAAYGGRGQGEDNKPPMQIRCIKCRKYSPREKVVRLDVADPDKGYWGCPHCRYKIDVCSGKVLRESSIDVGINTGIWARVLALAGAAEKRATANQN